MENSKLKLYAAIGLGALVVALFISAVLLSRSGGSSSTISGQQTYPATVQNVINSPILKTGDWSVLLDKPEYQISYSKGSAGDTFFITINATPVVKLSKDAEQEFLNVMRIDEKYACTLPVVINVPYKIDANATGYNFGMSFCSGRMHVADKASK